ncbi:MAG: HAD hydrolase-like protein [Clostridia bacterium]|nr:HAD hydrolase-like protein [Clostridia bacterium]
MKYKSVLFDLDGTLTDSGPGIRNAVCHALKRFGIEEHDESALNRFIGPPLYDSFMRFYGIPADRAKHGENYFREYYSDKGIFENSVYDGIPECLERLKNNGVSLFIATSKPDFMAQKVISHFNLDKYFELISGADIERGITAKSDVIRLLFENRSDIQPSSCVMVGDREHDVYGAAKFGIPCIGVMWGYGSSEEFSRSGALCTVNTPNDLAEYILS